MILSILIPSTYDRQEMLDSLVSHLGWQIKDREVEVLSDIDNYELSTGAKRNRLMQKAKGKYLAFVDSDDNVPSYYIEELLKGIEVCPDCCSLIGEITFNGASPQKFVHSIAYDRWFEKGSVFYRPPNHLNCIKREIALAVGFPEKNHGEDFDFSMNLLASGLLEKEYQINKLMYYYNYNDKH